MSKTRRKLFCLAAALISTCIALVVVEVALRVSGAYALDAQLGVNAHRRRGTSNPVMRSDIPGLHYVLRPGAQGVNSRGFRGPEIAERRPATRIIALGDSVTYAVSKTDARYEASWPYMLEQRFQNDGMDVQVINEGVTGYNSLQEVIHFKHFGLALDPDIVVLGFVLNDFEENVLQEMPGDDMPWQIDLSPRFIRQVMPIPDSVNRFLLEQSHTYRMFNHGLSAIVESDRTYDIGRERNLAALDELVQLLRDRDILLYVVIFPFTGFSYDEYPDDLRTVHASVHDFFAVRKVPVDDLITLVRDHDIAAIRDDEYCHFNPDGCRLISQYVHAGLLRHFGDRLK